MANRTVLRFQPNLAVTVKLDRGPEGKETRSQVNDAVQFMYTVNDDSAVMFLTAAARSALMRTHAQAGDTVRIVKQQEGQNITWRIDVLPPPQGEGEGDDYANKLEESIRQLPPKRAPQPIREAQQQQQQTQGANALAPAHTPAAVVLAKHDILARYFVLAGRALSMAHKQLATEGFALEPFNWEDVRASGISLFIEHNRQNGGQR